MTTADNREQMALELVTQLHGQNLLTTRNQESLVRSVCTIFHTGSAGILLIQDTTASLTYYDAEKVEYVNLEGVELDWGSGPIERSILKKTSLSFEGNADVPQRGVLRSLAKMKLPALLCAPLAAGNEKSGALFLLNPAGLPFQQGDQTLLSWIARNAAEIIHQQSIIQELQAERIELETGRKQLQHSRNVLRALFDSFPDGLYIIDHEYILTAINMQRAQRAQHHPMLLVGRKCHQALYGSKEPCPECRVMETLAAGKITTRNRREKTPGSEPLEWEVHSYPISGNQGETVQAILLERDVTEKSRLELTLAQSEKLAAMGQWAASLAHEINNPLTAIIANAQLLKREIPADDDKHELVDLIARAGERANQVVRNMLDLARKEEYLFGPTDVNQTIRRSLEYLQHELAARSINLLFEPAESLPLINASPDHLQGVWLNLLTNAMDSIERPDGEIRVETRQTESELHIVISDNGIGISPENKARIFEPFYTTKERGRGTGLGLAVCQRIIQQHGGRILVDSRTGEGTQFTVILPLA